MKVGLIGLGRMGEGMSRRMIKNLVLKFMDTVETMKKQKNQKSTGILQVLQILWKVPCSSST